MNRLKLIRERKSLTLAQLSARTSIPLRVLENYEAHVEEISPAHVKVLSKALWVKPDELLPAQGGPVAPEGPADRGAVPVGVPGLAAPGPAAMDGGLAPAAPGAAAALPPRPYTPAPGFGPPRAEPPRPPRPAGPAPAAADGRGARPPARGRREPVVMPATDGQITEIMRLAARLNLSTQEIEAQFGRSIENITRFDAREWIKKLREDAIAKAPPAKVHFGQWPGLKDDREAVYLAEERDKGSVFKVALFNGQVFEGRIIDFTPYTITLEQDTPGGTEQIVLRKLAVAYYQRSQAGTGARPPSEVSADARDLAPFPAAGAPPFMAPGAAATANMSANGSTATATPPAGELAGAPSGTEGAPSAGAGGEEQGS